MGGETNETLKAIPFNDNDNVVLLTDAVNNLHNISYYGDIVTKRMRYSFENALSMKEKDLKYQHFELSFFCKRG